MRMKIFKVALLLTTLLLTGISTEAQQHRIKYFSKSGVKEVAASEAHFFEIEEKNAQGGGTRTRYLIEDSSKVRQFTYSDLEGGEYKLGTADGPYDEWHNNGQLKVQANYSNNRLSGAYISWYESGKLRFSRKYLEGLPQDTLMGYYETGAVRRIEIYDGGEMVSGKLYEETGEEAEFFPMEQMPQFAGGEQMMLNWLGKTIRYPKTMYKKKVQGLVITSFVVKEDGSTSEAEVVRGIHPDGDAEALRVINSMPAWIPGQQEGKPVDVRYYLPVRYSIN